MARGITQDDVDRAANALLLAGERPTIERVRQFLGTGSPNTVTRLLENWWQGLGTRLQVRQQKVELPDAPPAVA
ncbi:DNA-binding protein, partial [Lysobacter sp. A3-1-A15]